MKQSGSRGLATVAAVKSAIFAAPLVLILGLVLLKLESWRLYWRFAAVEDGPVEYLTGVVYLSVFVVALLASAVFFRTHLRVLGLLYALFAAGCFFIAMEEISWGQRIFGFTTPPGLEEINHQGELNLHNIAGRWKLHAVYILVGASGAFAWFLLPRRIGARYRSTLDFLIPPWWLMLYFLPTFLLYTYYDYLSPVLVGYFGETWGWDRGEGGGQFMISKDQEPVELILSLGFLLLAVHTRMRQVRSTAPGTSYRAPQASMARVPQSTPA